MCFQRGEKYTQPSFVPPTCPAPWNWLAVGNGLPCNDFDWPIVSNLCSLLSLLVLNKGVSFFLFFSSRHRAENQIANIVDKYLSSLRTWSYNHISGWVRLGIGTILPQDMKTF